MFTLRNYSPFNIVEHVSCNDIGVSVFIFKKIPNACEAFSNYISQFIFFGYFVSFDRLWSQTIRTYLREERYCINIFYDTSN